MARIIKGMIMGELDGWQFIASSISMAPTPPREIWDVGRYYILVGSALRSSSIRTHLPAHNS